MGGVIQSGVFAHDQACIKAEAVRQSSVLGAAMSPAGQAVMNSAEIAWARACLASCKANNNSQGMEAFISVLKSLGTGGS
jgi:hypothetical protein